MSDFRGGGDYRDRERNWRDRDRSGAGAFSSDREERPFGGPDRERGFFGSEGQSRGFDRQERDRRFFPDGIEETFRGSDRDRELRPRSNQPGTLTGGGLFDRDDRDRERSNRESERSRFGNDDQKRSLPINETEQLIASNKVEGTPVYGREGERLGTIYNFMVDKYSGRVTYAVMSYGGFLGVGQRYYPLPWGILSYDTEEGGYRVDMDARDMERAPSFSRQDEPRFNRDYGQRVHSWYGLDY